MLAVFQLAAKLFSPTLRILFTSSYNSCMQMIGLVFYVIVATLHKNRLRPHGDSFSHQQLIIENQVN